MIPVVRDPALPGTFFDSRDSLERAAEHRAAPGGRRVSEAKHGGYESSHAPIGHAIEIELHLVPEPASVSKARQSLDELYTLVPPQTLDDLRLLVSELVTNSVVHAGLGPEDPITLRVSILGRVVLIEVTDHGPGFDPAPTDHTHPTHQPDRNGAGSASGTGGHGLYLVNAISDRWDSDHKDGVSRVWVEVNLEPAAG